MGRALAPAGAMETFTAKAENPPICGAAVNSNKELLRGKGAIITAAFLGLSAGVALIALTGLLPPGRAVKK